MRKHPIAFLLPLCLLMAYPVWSQVPAPMPKREFRAAWVATVLNIDYPRAGTPNAVALREQYKNLIDQLQDIGFNAVIFQVRPAADAFYPSEFAPWSRFLTGTQGLAPQPDFDPLAYMIEETHARGMEFHAWLNPFRATTNLDTTQLNPRHVYYTHPEWIVPYGTRYYLNPALPEVRQHLVEVVEEIVANYPVDGIHFDDYFYPYPIAGTPFPDSAAYALYGSLFPDTAAWRRDNINQVIEQISGLLRKSYPTVEFGISPFGVWRNREQDPRGSASRSGVATYDDLYADILSWMQAGWLDYVIPQLYWHIGFEPADHALLLQWWSRNTPEDVRLYIGHGAYKVANNPEIAWSNPGEIPTQIDLNRRNFFSKGSAFFSAKSVLTNPLGLKDSLRQLYKHPALLPVRSEERRALPPPTVKPARNRKQGIQLRWKVKSRIPSDQPHYFAIYRFPGSTVGPLEKPEFLRHTTPIAQGCRRYEFLDLDVENGQEYTYVITALNQHHQESSPSQSMTIKAAIKYRLARIY